MEKNRIKKLHLYFKKVMKINNNFIYILIKFCAFKTLTRTTCDIDATTVTKQFNGATSRTTLLKQPMIHPPE